ncbi:hypothetical protein B9T31_15000 [Acinetobacter sp. ANC 4558]|uniref:helix-turn-helix domain-containing protein n=1 Tax=Acinetobacter sp. ANC 4558 TaxID=1977876 RepID=UPI000A337313|nr:helix-turn-helix domain-containing protein [Acinetobacter sp. ANC 4558]OTG81827.1 hypothetical protein B9T31_15000 [Acinetobacter sp. ANC 4558]
MKSNLAHKPPDPQGEVVKFPKQERQAMSGNKFNYVTSIRDVPMEKTTKHVALTLATYADYETGICYPTIKTLMAVTGLSNRAVCLHLRKLEELGFIVSKKADGRNSKYKFIAENIKKAVTQGHSLNNESSDFDDIEAVTLMHEAVTLTTQSSDAGSHKLLITTINNQKNIHTQENTPEKNDFVEQWNPNLDHLKNILVQTKFSNRTEEILSMSDFQFHLGNFNAHWENKTYLTENQKTRKFASWLIQEFEKAERSVKAKTHTSGKQNNSEQKPKSALQATKDQWAQERLERQQQTSQIIDVNSPRFIGGGHEHF